MVKLWNKNLKNDNLTIQVGINQKNFLPCYPPFNYYPHYCMDTIVCHLILVSQQNMLFDASDL